MDAVAEKVDYRQARGLALVRGKASRIRQIPGDTYLVPSASSNGGAGYVVDMAAGKCTCPDYEERGLPCKYQCPVRYHRHELEMPDGTTVVTETLQVTKRVTYPQDWPAYNRAQCEEKDSCADPAGRALRWHRAAPLRREWTSPRIAPRCCLLRHDEGLHYAEREASHVGHPRLQEARVHRATS